MRILILGSGLLGVLSAYYLGRDGHQVTLLERNNESARECSYANGGQLSYSHAEPWANPHIFPKLWKWMRDEDAPLVLKLSSDPHMLRWGLSFLYNCSPARARANCITLLRLGLFSRKKMAEIRADTGIDFDWQNKGILHLFSREGDLAHAERQMAFQAKYGCEERLLTPEQCIALEPTLSASHDPIIGGIYSPQDESGDVFRFTQLLAQHVQAKYGATFEYGVDVERLVKEGDCITAIQTDSGERKADAYVISLGAWTPLLLRPLGIHLPIYPMKGYSITFPASDKLPLVSITDDARKIVYSRLGDRIRVAGTAEFAGYNTAVNPARIRPIVRGIQQLFPEADISRAEEWACLRPSTPYGPPIIGKTKLKNLYLNTGHGTLGWTQGAGSASLLSALVTGNTPEISLEGLTMERYG